MNKKEFAIALSNKQGISQREAMDRLDQVIEVIVDQLTDHEDVKLRGFGTFKTVFREEREMFNPRTNEEMIVPERYIPVFIPGKTLKKSVRGGSNISKEFRDR